MHLVAYPGAKGRGRPKPMTKKDVFKTPENVLCIVTLLYSELLKAYPPSERSELARYHVMLFSFRLCALSI